MVRLTSPGSALKKRTPMVKPIEKTASVSKELPKPLPRKPAPPKKQAPPREVKPVEEEKVVKKPEVPRASAPRKEAQEPAVTTERPSEPSGPRLTYPKPEGARPQVGQVTMSQLKTMEYKARKALFKQLNTGVPVEKFVTLRRRDDLPKKLVMRLAEARARKIVSKTTEKDAYYCPYCVEFMPFHYHSHTGYTKCTGCGISTMDFYTRADNQLFMKEV